MGSGIQITSMAEWTNARGLRPRSRRRYVDSNSTAGIGGVPNWKLGLAQDQMCVGTSSVRF